MNCCMAAPFHLRPMFCVHFRLCSPQPTHSSWPIQFLVKWFPSNVLIQRAISVRCSIVHVSLQCARRVFDHRRQRLISHPMPRCWSSPKPYSISSQIQHHRWPLDLMQFLARLSSNQPTCRDGRWPHRGPSCSNLGNPSTLGDGWICSLYNGRIVVLQRCHYMGIGQTHRTGSLSNHFRRSRKVCIPPMRIHTGMTHIGHNEAWNRLKWIVVVSLKESDS